MHDSYVDLVIPLIPNLKRRALSLTRNREDAEDLLQNTLLRAYRFWHRYEPGTHIDRWLFIMMKRLYINKYRQDKRAPDLISIYEDQSNDQSNYTLAERLHDESPSVEDQVIGREGWDGFTELLREELSESYLDVWLLREAEGLSYREIAAKLDVPVGTVMSRLHRARQAVERLAGSLV